MVTEGLTASLKKTADAQFVPKIWWMSVLADRIRKSPNLEIFETTAVVINCGM